ncbi:MAG: hypothetical protein N2038_05610 [Geminicoccaceae bacterium]|nr:hypothetical protein [Geminicoccaceae bacterium]MCX7629711.1 hypothetical protein [Geminicoccaceae bacterium]MDW8369031.1 hypothetical protein [Geminicoccaceae bacterium]
MSNTAGISASDPTDAHADGLRALALALLGSGEGAQSSEGPSQPPRNEPLVLRIEDLVADERGEIVLSASETLRGVVLTTEQEVTASGIAEPDRRASGEEVGGYGYVVFAAGATVFFAPGLEVEVVAPGS